MTIPLLLVASHSSAITTTPNATSVQKTFVGSKSQLPASEYKRGRLVFAQNTTTRTTIRSDCLSETSGVVGPAEKLLFEPTDQSRLPVKPSHLSLQELVNLCEKETKLSFDGEVEYRIFVLLGLLRENAEQEASYLNTSARKGNVKSLFLLGIAYYEGTEFKKNIPKSIYFLEKSAEAGFVSSMKRLSSLYQEIEFEPGNFNVLKVDNIESSFMGKQERVPRWIYWLQRASELDTQSAVKLARFYERGQGVLQDENIAIKLLSTASETGDLAGAIALGSIYMKRSSSPNYLKLGVRQIEHAARLGDQSSQLLVGRAYLKGTGVDVDRVKAEYWLRKSAQAGNSQAKKLVELHFEAK